MRAILFCAAVFAAGCSTHPQVYRSMQEQVVSLRQGDLESAGLAFITPSTVTGQEQEKQAVALTFTDILRAVRPGVRIVSLAETLGAVNRAGLADDYRRMYAHYGDTGLFPGDDLRRIGAATGARYLAHLQLQGFSQDAKGRFNLLGLRLVETHYADLRLFLQVWDSQEAAVAWEAMQELRIAYDAYREEPVMLRKLLERGARDMTARLP
jgi:hypothetical protein